MNEESQALRMRAASVAEQFRVELHCPSCGGHPVSRESADPWAICLACNFDHRFFIMPASPYAAITANSAGITLPEMVGLSTTAIASFWLSGSGARYVLNDQLAPNQVAPERGRDA